MSSDEAYQDLIEQVTTLKSENELLRADALHNKRIGFANREAYVLRGTDLRRPSEFDYSCGLDREARGVYVKLSGARVDRTIEVEVDGVAVAECFIDEDVNGHPVGVELLF